MKTNQSLERLAEAVYSALFGHLDDKYYHAEKVQDIYDWLYNGDLSDDPDLNELIEEWREYDEGNPNIL